jgi:hypothetical protein|tara:strand:+ start:2639 stop:3280 length:642 start_codon:yes stop_codon:yes gene_type:complete
MTQNIFQDTQESGLANYSYGDITAATGTLTFYGARAGTGPSYILTANLLNSEPVGESAVIQDIAGPQTIFDIDFDTVINKQLVIRGTTIVNIPIAGSTGGAGPTYNVIITAKIRQWDGATETDIVSADSTTWNINLTTTYRYMAIPLNIPQTIIKRGNTLRLTVIYTATRAGGAGAGGTGAVAYDPANRTAGWDATGVVPSQLIAPIPTKIQL